MSKKMINYEFSEASCGEKNENASEAPCDKQNGSTFAASGNSQYDNSASSKIIKYEDPVAVTSRQYKAPYAGSTSSIKKDAFTSSKPQFQLTSTGRTHYSRKIDSQSDNSLQHCATSATMPDNSKYMSGELIESQKLGNQSSYLSQKEIRNMIKFETSNQPPDYSQEVVVVSEESNQPSNKLPDKLPNQPTAMIKDITYLSPPGNLYDYFNGALSVSVLDENRGYALQLKRKSLEALDEIYKKILAQLKSGEMSNKFGYEYRLELEKKYHINQIARIDLREVDIAFHLHMNEDRRRGLASKCINRMLKKYPVELSSEKVNYLVNIFLNFEEVSHIESKTEIDYFNQVFDITKKVAKQLKQRMLN